MWSTLKISSGAQLGHDKRVIPAFDTVLFHSNLSSLRRKYLSDFLTDKSVLTSGPKLSKRALKHATVGLKIKKENVISGLSREGFWQPLIASEARKERSCHFFFASHIFPRADCLFYHPAFLRPDRDNRDHPRIPRGC